MNQPVPIQTSPFNFARVATGSTCDKTRVMAENPRTIESTRYRTHAAVDLTYIIELSYFISKPEVQSHQGVLRAGQTIAANVSSAAAKCPASAHADLRELIAREEKEI